MTKKIFSAVVASMLIFSASVSAQTTASKSSDKKAECTKTEKCMRNFEKAPGELKCEAKGACEFEGLNLTDTQKEQLKALKKKQFEQSRMRKDSMKAERKFEKEKVREERKAMKEQRQADRRAYLNEVKEILGPDNYLLFLENQYVQMTPNTGRGHQLAPAKPMMKPDARFEKGKGPKKNKCDKKCDKHEKGKKGDKACKDEKGCKAEKK